MARFFADGDELLYRKDLMKLFDLSKNNVLNPDNLANKNFDLNSKWYGMKVAQEDVPINGKENWSLYFDFEVDGYNRIQLNISVNSNIYIRSFSGRQIWSDWKQIGGVTSLLSHIRQGLRRVAFKETEVA